MLDLFIDHTDIMFNAWDWNKLAKSIGADKQPNYGLLADELVGTNPEALEKDENGYWKINYFKLRQNKKE